jgi:hypothetical protein
MFGALPASFLGGLFSPLSGAPINQALLQEILKMSDLRSKIVLERLNRFDLTGKKALAVIHCSIARFRARLLGCGHNHCFIQACDEIRVNLYPGDNPDGLAKIEPLGFSIAHFYA